jgi:DNA repair protein RecO (recombination protein O)
VHWTDEAIILSIRKFGENKSIIRAFVRGHGVYGGVVRGASSKSMRGIFQPGNVVSTVWQARLSEQLGAFKGELLTPYAAWVMQDPLKLSALASACALLEVALPERHPYPKLYDIFLEFLKTLAGDVSWQAEYIRLEMEILAESGFGLELDSCAATGKKDDLVYVSPKSGRAVSKDAGEPYKEKMLHLPAFLQDKKSTVSAMEILAGLRLSGYFLDQRLTAPHGKKLPAARVRLEQMMKEVYAA